MTYHEQVLDRPVAESPVEARAAFITRTYMHLFGAIGAFVLIEAALFQTGVAQRLAPQLAGNWMLVLGAFLVVGWLGSHVAHSARSLPMQYLALGGFVLAEALIFMPLLYAAAILHDGVIASAAVVTLGGFAGLTMIAFLTRKDFSFLRSVLMWVGLCSVVLVFASMIFGWHLGTWFSVGMIAFAGGSILYDTSNVIHHYPEDRYVGAALELFASVAVLFWYVLRIFMSRD